MKAKYAKVPPLNDTDKKNLERYADWSLRRERLEAVYEAAKAVQENGRVALIYHKPYYIEVSLDVFERLSIALAMPTKGEAP